MHAVNSAGREQEGSVTTVDLVIRGGEIVNADTKKKCRADIGISGGIVVQIGGEMHAENEMDAAGSCFSRWD